MNDDYYGDQNFDEDDFEDFEGEHPGMVLPRPCQRCGAIPTPKKYHPMCAEVQLAFGLITWLCHDCRRDWHKNFKTHPLNDQYTRAQMKLEYWKATVPNKSFRNSTEWNDEYNNGLVYSEAVYLIELKINDEANSWLIT